MVTTGVVAMEATVLATAVTVIVDDIGGFAQYPWLFSIFLLTQAVTVPVYSKLADTIGRKPILLFGIAVFLLASVLCALAWDMTSLIVFRAVQGIGAGAVLPMTITIVGDIYTVAERARVQGYIASVWAMASVAGPSLGGLFAMWDAWRWIFWINLPLCILAFVMLARRYREELTPTRHRIDYLGATLLMVGLTLILLGTLEGGVAWEWTSPISFAVFGTGAALLVIFAFVEARAAEPILPGWLFRRRLLTTTNVLGAAIGVVLIGVTAFIPTYLVTAAGVGPLVAGLTLAPLLIGWPIAASQAGRLYLRWGFRPVAILGGVLVTVGSIALAWVSGTPHIVTVGAACLIVGLGLGFSAVPTLVAAQSSVAWHGRGVVTGANMFSRSAGQAVGAAILGAVSNAIIASRGGVETDPATMTAASTAVFIGVSVAALLILVSALAMPREEAPSAGEQARA